MRLIRRLSRCALALLLLVGLSACRTARVSAERPAPRTAPGGAAPAGPPASAGAQLDAYREPGNALLRRGENVPLALPGLGTRDPWTLMATGSTGYILGGSGAPDAFTNAAALSLIHRFHIFSTLTMTLAYNRRDYAFDDGKGLFAGVGAAPDEYHTLAGTVSLFQPLSTKWAVFLSAGFAGSAEVGVDLLEDPSFIGIFVVGTQVNPKLQLGVGVLAGVRPGEDPFFIPIPQFTWNISDRWTFATEDAGGGFTYEASSTLKLSGLLQFDTRRYRLNATGPGTPGIFEDSRTSLLLRARWEPTEEVQANFVAGLDVIRYLEVADEDGNVLRNEDAGLGGFVRFLFSVAF